MNTTEKFIKALSNLPDLESEGFWLFFANEAKRFPEEAKLRTGLRHAISELQAGRDQPRPNAIVKRKGFRAFSGQKIHDGVLKWQGKLMPFIDKYKDWKSLIGRWILENKLDYKLKVLNVLDCWHDEKGVSLEDQPPAWSPEEATQRLMALSSQISFANLEIIAAGLFCDHEGWGYLEQAIDLLNDAAKQAKKAAKVPIPVEPTSMTTTDDSDDLATRLQALPGQVNALVAYLNDITAELQAGRLPDLTTIARTVEPLQSEWTILIAELRPTEPSLAGLKAALEAQKGHTEALALLDRLQRLRHREKSQFPGIAIVRQRCVDLRQRIAQTSCQDEAIIAELKPLYTLEHFIECYANIGEAAIDEATIGELDTEVRNHFGVEIAIAASFRRLEFVEPDVLTDEASETSVASTDLETAVAPVDTPSSPESVPIVDLGSPTQAIIPEKKAASDDPPLSTSKKETVTTQKAAAISLDEANPGDDESLLVDHHPQAPPSTETDQSTPTPMVAETIKAKVNSIDEIKNDTQYSNLVDHRESKKVITFKDFSIDIDISTLCSFVRDSQGNDTVIYANGLVWKLIYDNRIGLATYLAEALCAQYGEEHCAVPPDLLRAIVLSATLQNATGSTSEYLRELITRLFSLNFDQRTSQKKTLIALYALAATLRPSLVAPDTTGAHNLLSKIPLSENFGALHQLRQTILEYRSFGFAQNPMFLRIAHEMNSWQETASRIQDEASDWWVSNRQRVIKFERATHIWQHWLKPEQSLGRVLEIISNNSLAAKSEVKSFITQWSDPAYVKRAIKETDMGVHGKKARLRPIEGDSLQTLLRSVSEMMELPKQWLDVISAHPEGKTDGLSRKAQEWRDSIQSIVPVCLKELSDFLEQDSDSLQTHASVLVAKRAIDGFISVLKDGPRQAKVAWYHIQNGELLHLEEPPRNENWVPEQIPDLNQILSIAEKTNADWPETLDRHIRRCDQITASRIVEYLEAVHPEKLDIEEIRRMALKQTESIERCRSFLAQYVSELSNRIECAVMLSQLAESDRIHFIEILEKATQPNLIDFRAELNQLEEIDKFLEEGRRAQVREVRERLGATNIREQHPEVFQRIDQLLDQGDTLTANEYIALTENGQAIPESKPKSDPFLDFFPDQVASLNRYLADQRPRALVDSIRAGRDFGPISMQGVPGSQAATAASMLEAWLLIKDRREPQEKIIRDFLNNLGFQIQSVSANNAHSGLAWFDVHVHPISDRDSCIIPRYGSLAHGHYKLLCVWNAPSEGEVLSHAHLPSRDLPIIVLYLSRMTEQRHRDLAYQCRERRQTVIIIDETLVYLLCSVRGPRIPLLFYCTFPFTIENPYTIASSNVPVEMFFGRKQERQSLLDPYGSNLLYGGRQLGKTALLREVERENHALHTGFIVHWIDLKAEGIGLIRPAHEIWDVICATLRNDGVIQKQVTVLDKIREQIFSWLDQDHQRRVLLLLDEADAFLFEDRSKKYETLAKLKDLMDRTSRRFKIVLAGLHNVQRSARDVNTPIAHMGQPVCIGPLLDNGEVQEALRLITLPFSTLGYRFDRDVASRILSHTNYYPSLIQIFCWHLLEHLNDNGRTQFGRSISPPYQIKIQHVEEAYQKKDLRDAIAERFRFTLELDGRYRLIALILALETLERRKAEKDTSDGFDVDWIRGEALEIWPEGFDEKTYEIFRNLLDEMIGLGILRRASESGNKYALRSPNVINLLGTEEEIQEALLDAVGKEKPLVYDASAYRRYLPEDHWIRSPLTGQQESEILESVHGVNVIFGMLIAGLERVKIFLERLGDSLPNVCVSVLESVNDLTAFEKALNSAFDRPDNNWDGVHLIVIDYQMPWTEYSILKAAEIIRKRRTRRVFHRVVFIGDPATAWHWIMIKDEVQLQLEKLPVKIFGLQTWKDGTLRRWMEDVGFGPVNNPEQRKLFTGATGNWGEILHELGAQIRPNPTHWQECVKNFDLNIDWLERVGLKFEACPLLKSMNEYGDILEDDIKYLETLLEPEYHGLWPQVLRWADLLGIVQAIGRKTWRIDPMIGKLLARSGK